MEMRTLIASLIILAVAGIAIWAWRKGLGRRRERRYRRHRIDIVTDDCRSR